MDSSILDDFPEDLSDDTTTTTYEWKELKTLHDYFVPRTQTPPIARINIWDEEGRLKEEMFTFIAVTE